MSRPQSSSRRTELSATNESAKSRRTRKKAASRSTRTDEVALDVSSLKSLQIVVPETNDGTADYRLFRVLTGWSQRMSVDGIEFVTTRRLSSNDVYIEFRTDDFALRFELIEIQHESMSKNGHWSYVASFNRRRTIVDRYEFD